MKIKRFSQFLNEDYQAYSKGEPIKGDWDRFQKTKWRPADSDELMAALAGLGVGGDPMTGIGPDTDALRMDAAVQSASKSLKNSEAWWQRDKLQRAIFGLAEADVLSVARAAAAKLGREKVEKILPGLFSILETEPSTIDSIIQSKPAPSPAPSPAEIIAAIGTKLRPDAVLGFCIMRTHVLGMKPSQVRNALLESLLESLAGRDPLQRFEELVDESDDLGSDIASGNLTREGVPADLSRIGSEIEREFPEIFKVNVSHSVFHGGKAVVSIQLFNTEQDELNGDPSGYREVRVSLPSEDDEFGGSDRYDW